jgi:hypothetical protein
MFEAYQKIPYLAVYISWILNDERIHIYHGSKQVINYAWLKGKEKNG